MRYLVSFSAALSLIWAVLVAVPVARGQEAVDVAKLTASLASKDSAARAKAADELGKVGDKARPALPSTRPGPTLPRPLHILGGTRRP